MGAQKHGWDIFDEVFSDANQLNNRAILPDANYAVGTNSATWLDAENVRNLVITVIPDASATNEKFAWVVFDAPDTATAVAWLAQAASGSVSSNIVAIPLNERVTFTGSSYFSRIDFDVTANSQAFIEGN